jgi:hypothetical protein
MSIYLATLGQGDNRAVSKHYVEAENITIAIELATEAAEHRGFDLYVADCQTARPSGAPQNATESWLSPLDPNHKATYEANVIRSKDGQHSLWYVLASDLDTADDMVIDAILKMPEEHYLENIKLYHAGGRVFARNIRYINDNLLGVITKANPPTLSFGNAVLSGVVTFILGSVVFVGAILGVIFGVACYLFRGHRQVDQD